MVKKVVNISYLLEGKKAKAVQEGEREKQGEARLLAGWCAVRGVCTGSSLGRTMLTQCRRGVNEDENRQEGLAIPWWCRGSAELWQLLATKVRPVKPAPWKSRPVGAVGLAWRPQPFCSVSSFLCIGHILGAGAQPSLSPGSAFFSIIFLHILTPDPPGSQALPQASPLFSLREVRSAVILLMGQGSRRDGT